MEKENQGAMANPGSLRKMAVPLTRSVCVCACFNTQAYNGIE